MNLISFDDAINIVLPNDELKKLCSPDFGLTERHPELNSEDKVACYFREMMQEEYVYEMRLQTLLRDNDILQSVFYTYPHDGLFLSADRILQHFGNSQPCKPWTFYMNTGLRRPSGDAVFVKVKGGWDKKTNQKETNQKETDQRGHIFYGVYLVTTPSEMPERARGLGCVGDLYGSLLVKRSVNVRRLHFTEAEINHTFQHVTEDDDHWSRVSDAYKKADGTAYTPAEARSDEALRQRFAADVDYSLEQLVRHPEQALPFTLGMSLTEEKQSYYYRCISQFAIPFYPSGEPLYPHGMLIINCEFPDDSIWEYMNTLHRIGDEVRQHLADNDVKKGKIVDRQVVGSHFLEDLEQLKSEEMVDFLLYSYCRYHLSTVYSLEMMPDNLLFARNGEQIV